MGTQVVGSLALFSALRLLQKNKQKRKTVLLGVAGFWQIEDVTQEDKGISFSSRTVNLIPDVFPQTRRLIRLVLINRVQQEKQAQRP